MHRLTYSVITPVRDEADTLPRLAEALRVQTRLPSQWVIVEAGSNDASVQVAATIVGEYGWARLLVLNDPRAIERERGAPIVRALHAGLDALDTVPDVVVSVDADVTMEPHHFERLLERFERDPLLGIASGSAWECQDGAWRQRFVTGGTVWGAARAWRWTCLRDVLPLEQRHGWDGVDQLKARARGWRTKTFTDLPFRHHRVEGARESSRWAHWLANGHTSHFMGYRAFYLLARTAHQMRRDPAALGLLVGYLVAAARRTRRLDDPEARAVLLRDQRLGNILRRRREALGLVDDPVNGDE